MKPTSEKLYIALISVHGLIRSHDLELGRDADTGGQTLYVVQLARALARQYDVAQVDLITRRVLDADVSDDYSALTESLSDGARIVRLDSGSDGYVSKEQLWDDLDALVDNAATFFRSNGKVPDVFHSHYADAGYVGSRLASLLGVPLIHTGHSLGRVKRHRLLASGLISDEVEQRYNMARRIEAEELALASAERVITSTFQEIEEQYELYDHYQPAQMRVLPPGTDVTQFIPTNGLAGQDPLYTKFTRFFKEPDKPLILALSRADKRKNITALVHAYGQSSELQQKSNLAIIAGNRDDVDDLDECAQEVFHELFVAIDRYDLYGKVALPKHHCRTQVPIFYRIAAHTGGVFVNPALTEPFGLTLIEAAASGLPVVATADGGPRDIIGNCQNGILVDPLDSQDIASSILKLLNDRDLWLTCAANGLKGVREYYSWDSHAQRYLDIVRPIAERTELLERKPIARRRALYRDRAIVSDLDQNLLGDPLALRCLIEVLKKNRKTTKFGIATGRRLDSALKVMRKNKIPEPDILITSSGSEIHYAPTLTVDTSWRKHIDYLWTPHIVKQTLKGLPGLKLQPKCEQSRYKISYYIDPEIAPDIEELNRLLHHEEQSVHLQFAFGQYLDILPMRASKGLALRYIADRWGIPLERIFVAGGSGADEDMMRGNTLASVVANRHHEELSKLMDVERIYFSSQPFSQGILEALDYYDFFGRCEAPDENDSYSRIAS
ncbi:Sucrose phosphate synthase [hydrothermal vent metagenome]|uniref:sucrose-phosphate synthase n=2 Tax=hydrothermal vent metagenome TaxID=652676 RepID=A0A3B0Z9Z1_9ZZZZ